MLLVELRVWRRAAECLLLQCGQLCAQLLLLLNKLLLAHARCCCCCLAACRLRVQLLLHYGKQEPHCSREVHLRVSFLCWDEATESQLVWMAILLRQLLASE